MRTLIVVSMLGGIAGFAVDVRGAVFQTDDFQSGTTENWTGNFTAPPVLQLNGGPAGVGDAFLLASTNSPTGPGSNLSAHNSSSDWTGDYASLNAGSVKVDLMSPLGSAALEMRLVLFGPVDLNDRWTSTNAAIVPNDGVWRSFEFSLAEADLTQIPGSSTYEVMFGNVFRVMLRHDAGGPSSGGSTVSGSVGIDNVRLVAAAPPLNADFDDDGDVDGDDLSDPVDGWESRFGVDLDGSDFLVWQQEFGLGPSLPLAQTVPEPNGVLLGAMAALLCLRPHGRLQTNRQGSRQRALL